MSNQSSVYRGLEDELFGAAEVPRSEFGTVWVLHVMLTYTFFATS